MEMEKRQDLRTMLPYLPVVLRSSSLFWPSQVVEALKSMSKGPDHSRVDSGEVLFLAISDIRRSSSSSHHHHHRLASSSPEGFSLFFDELMSRAESKNWFGQIVPAIANLLLRLPSLLETHYQNATTDAPLFNGVKTGLRILEQQEAGIVILSQELIGALLACSFFCLFPTTNRGAKHLPTINFDHMFASLYENYSEKLEHKIKCVIHYFERIRLRMPTGFVSFERKILPWDCSPLQVSYPDANFWSKSLVPLCQFQIHKSGLIEDQLSGGLEVDFANKYLGGGALHRGCIQEEIRFMINPELISGMLFLPSMSDNEAIEIVGTERFSNYTGYASTFRFSGDYVDRREVDSLGRRKTRIIAIDALCSARMKQYELEFLIREINKAFCGFFDPSKYQQYRRMFQTKLDEGCSNSNLNNLLLYEDRFNEPNKEICGDKLAGNPFEKSVQFIGHHDEIGIVTGNWGCGAFGGDPEIKAIIQWLAASQALRPFISYYTFGVEALRNLDQVTRWIVSHEWTVGDLWHLLVEYSTQRYEGETNLGFLAWLVPSISTDDIEMHDIPCAP